MASITAIGLGLPNPALGISGGGAIGSGTPGTITQWNTSTTLQDSPLIVDASMHIDPSGAADTNVLAYNSASGKWKPASAVGGGGVTGTGASPQVAYWTSASVIAGDADVLLDSTNHRLIVGGATVAQMPVATFTASVLSTRSAILANHDSGFSAVSWSTTGASSSFFNGISARGSVASPAKSQNGDVLIRLAARGYYDDGAGSNGYSNEVGQLIFSTAEDFVGPFNWGSSAQINVVTVGDTTLVPAMFFGSASSGLERSLAGGLIEFYILNDDNTNASSRAMLAIGTGGTSSGDASIALSGNGIWGIGQDNSDSGKLKLDTTNVVGAATKMAMTIHGGITWTPTAVAAGETAYTLTAAAHTAVVAELIDANFNLARTVTFTHASAPATQRASLFQAPTYSNSSSTDTITTAATVAITGAPVAAGGITITHPYALWVQAGDVLFAGNLLVSTDLHILESITGGLGSQTVDFSNQIWRDATHPGYPDIVWSARIYDATGASQKASVVLDYNYTGLTTFTVSGGFVSTPVAVAGGQTLLLMTGAPDTALIAEVSDINYNLARTVTFTHGSVPATQRAALFQAPTYASSASSDTITTAATMAITGAPATGSNMTITNPYALWVQAGNVTFAGGLNVGTGTRAPNAGQVDISNSGAAGGFRTFAVFPGSHTALVAEVNDVRFGLTRTVTFTHGSAPATQRAIVFTAPTYSNDTSTDTITTAATLDIGGAPAAAGGITITNPYALWVEAGNVLFAGGLNVGFSPGATPGTIKMSPSALAGGQVTLNMIGAPDTALVAEVLDVDFNFTRTVTFTHGSVPATQRSIEIRPPTYATSSSTDTITTAATVNIQGAPAAGTGITITNAYALRIVAGNVIFGGSTTLVGGVNVGAATQAGTGDVSASGLMTENRYPVGNETIDAGYCAVIASDYEIPSGFVLDILSDGIMEII